MRHERATDELREVAALYALGSLTQNEARNFETHLSEGCLVCETELRQFKRAAAGIGAGVNQAEPPEYIRDLLSARIEREPQIDMKQDDKVKPELDTVRTAPMISYINEPQKKKTSILPWFLVAVLAIAAGLGGYLWKMEKGKNAQLQTKITDTQSNEKVLQGLLDTLREKNGNFEQLLETVSKPGTKIALLKGPAGIAGPLGEIIWDAEQNQCVIMGSFTSIPDGKTYQLWFITPTAKIPGGIFKFNPTGGTFAKIPIPVNAADATAIMLTVEPEGGSQVPTLPFYAVGPVN
jgi:anti-sigma-K factor RskA